MIETNNDELKNEIEKLDNLIDSYEDIQLNLFNQLENVVTNWQDGNSVEFEDAIYLEKNEASLILESLNERQKTLNFIYDKYSEFGNKIKCNLNNKNNVLNEIDNNIKQVNSILNEFNRIDRSFYYNELISIDYTENKVLEVKNQLVETKNMVKKMYKQIDGIERQINAKIAELEEYRIQSFDYDLR